MITCAAEGRKQRARFRFICLQQAHHSDSLLLTLCHAKYTSGITPQYASNRDSLDRLPRLDYCGDLRGGDSSETPYKSANRACRPVHRAQLYAM
jgi:hypothetical protein